MKGKRNNLLIMSLENKIVLIKSSSPKYARREVEFLSLLIQMPSSQRRENREL